MRTITKTVFQFSELSEEAKEKARDWYRSTIDYPWWDFIFYDAKEVGKILGIEIGDIYFTGFCSQGDGACFTGNYSYAKGAVKAIKEYAPKDTVLHQIARDLQAAQKPYFYKLGAGISHRGHYYHAYSMLIDVTHADDCYREVDQDGIKEALIDFANWIYRQLGTEWGYINSDESVDESIACNGYEFYENGERA